MSTTVYTYNDKVLVNSANDKWLKKLDAPTYTITYNQGTSTSITGEIPTPTGPAEAAEGDTVTLSSGIPSYAANWVIVDHYTLDGAAIEGNTFTMPAHSVIVSAVYRTVF